MKVKNFANKAIKILISRHEDSDTKSVVYDRSLLKFNEYLSGVLTSNYNLGSYLCSYGDWIFEEGLIKCFTHKNIDAGIDDMRIGFCSNYYGFLLLCFEHDADSKSQKEFYFLRDASLWMSIGMALGYERETDLMGKIIVDGIPKKMFSFEETPVTAFIVSLWTQYRDIELPKLVNNPRKPKELVYWRHIEVYSELLANWRNPDEGVFVEKTIAACDQHIKESKYSNNQKDYDFEIEIHQLFSQEILAVLQLRKKNGLSVPVIDHPALTPPFNVPLSSDELVFDDILKPVVDKIYALHPGIEGAWVKHGDA